MATLKRASVCGIFTCLALICLLFMAQSPLSKSLPYLSMPTIKQRAPPLPASRPIDKEYEYLRVPDLSFIEQRFAQKTNDRLCNNTCRPGDLACEAKTVAQWRNVIITRQLHGVELFSATEYVFPWELPYLKDPPLTDTNALPSLSKSKVYFVEFMSRRADKNETYADELATGRVIVLKRNTPAKYRVVLRDEYGNLRLRGGDEVRAWLTGTVGVKKMSITCQVEDYQDGTYGLTAIVTWTGTARLHIAVTYPREYIRASLNHRRRGANRFVYGKFKRGNVEEVTFCHSTPNVPGRPCLCNMTSMNGLSYYCGKPHDRRLSCEDRPFMDTDELPAFTDYTPAEEAMSRNGSRIPRKAEIRHNLTINITEGRKDPVLPPCQRSERRLSWTKTSPRGWWSRDASGTVWNSLICREPPMSSRWAQECLKSTNVWMIGDSNIRLMVRYLADVFQCPPDYFMKIWPGECVCRNEKYNINLRFRPHEYPLYVSNRWMEFLDNGKSIDFLDAIPSQGNHLIVLHYYLHFSNTHLSVLRQRLGVVKEAVSRLLIRIPSAVVVIRGPHTSAVEWSTNHIFGGDVLAARVREMYLEMFHDLRDKIIFLDGWDRSISSENLNLHPPKYFVMSLWRTILSYKCNRD